jgi:branched-subunit amino acid transport protein
VTLSTSELWSLIAGLAVVTLVARNFFLVLPPRWQPRGTVEQALRVAPLAALLAITVPEIVRDLPARLAASADWTSAAVALVTDPRLVSAGVLAVVAGTTRRALWGLAAGATTYLALLLATR